MITFFKNLFRTTPISDYKYNLPNPSWIARLTSSNTTISELDLSNGIIDDSLHLHLTKSAELCKLRVSTLKKQVADFESLLKTIKYPHEQIHLIEAHRKSLFYQKQAIRYWKDIIASATNSNDLNYNIFFIDKINRPIAGLDGLNLLSYFAISRDIEVCVNLLSLGANPDAENENETSPILIIEKKLESFSLLDSIITTENTEYCSILTLFQKFILENALKKSEQLSKSSKSKSI